MIFNTLIIYKRRTHFVPTFIVTVYLPDFYVSCLVGINHRNTQTFVSTSLSLSTLQRYRLFYCYQI